MTFAFVQRVLCYAVGAIALLIIGFWILPRLTRRSRTTLDDIIVGVVRVPAALLVLVSGAATSTHLLSYSEQVRGFIASALASLDVMLIAWLLLRLVKHIVRRFAERHARTTESNIDEVLLPIVDRRILPLVISLAAGAMILHVLGVRLVSIFTALGAMSFLLLLIFQEPLSNLLSGVYLVVDVPFKYGDLLLLEDGITYRVEEIGARVTSLYNTEEHTLAYIPNRKLAEQKIVNVTRPNVQLRAKLPVEVSYDTAIPDDVKTLLETAATGHPHVLADPNKKIALLERRVRELGLAALDETAHQSRREQTRQQLDRLVLEVHRIGLENEVRKHADRLIREFRLLSRFAQELGWDGLSAAQRDSLRSGVDKTCSGICGLQQSITLWVRVVGHLESTYKRDECPLPDIATLRAKLPTTDQLLHWMRSATSQEAVKNQLLQEGLYPALGVLADAEEEFFLGGSNTWLRNARSIRQDQENANPFLVLDDWEHDSPSWGVHVDRLRHYRSWHKPMRNLLRHVQRCRDLKRLGGIREFVFHERIEAVVGCLEGQFPLIVPSWQYPDADFKEFRSSGLLFELEFFLDDLVLEHFQQAEDTCSEVGLWIFEALQEQGISIPYPQRDVRVTQID